MATGAEGATIGGATVGAGAGSAAGSGCHAATEGGAVSETLGIVILSNGSGEATDATGSIRRGFRGGIGLSSAFGGFVSLISGGVFSLRGGRGILRTTGRETSSRVNSILANAFE